MLRAYDGCLHLFRLDVCSECVIRLDEDITGSDADELCEMLTYGGLTVEDAEAYARQFKEWWNANDVIAMLELDDDWGLYSMSKPLVDAGVYVKIAGLSWELD